MTKIYLFDIEGTTTDINFVHQVLFPYSQNHLEKFLQEHENHPVVSRAIAEVKETAKAEEKRVLNLAGVIEKLQSWIKHDRKHAALKEIQGLIWDSGYSKNDFKGHVYPDVKPFFEKILTSTESKIGIYSSGSVHAQKLIFGYSSDGDLTPYISHYFDTKVGPKRESSSYLAIARELEIAPQDIGFFSDIPEELEAARKAGMEVIHVVRPGTESSAYESISTFNEIAL